MGWERNVSVNGGSSKPMRKKSEKKSTRVEPHKIFFPKKDIANKIQQASYRSETMLPAERTSSLGNKTGDIHDEREYTGLEKKIQEQNSHLSPLRDKTDQQMDFQSPAQGDQQDIANPSVMNVVDPQGTFQSPTFEFKAPISSSTPTSTPKIGQLVHDAPTLTPKRGQLVHGVLNPAPAERIFTLGDIRSYRTLRDSKPDRNESNMQTGFSVDAEELKFSPPRKQRLILKRKIQKIAFLNHQKKRGTVRVCKRVHPSMKHIVVAEKEMHHLQNLMLLRNQNSCFIQLKGSEPVKALDLIISVPHYPLQKKLEKGIGSKNLQSKAKRMQGILNCLPWNYKNFKAKLSQRLVKNHLEF